VVGYNQNMPDVWGSFANGMEIGGALRRRQQQTEYGEAYQQGGWEAVGDAAGGQGDLQTAEAAQGVSQAQQANSRARALENATVLQRLYQSLTPLDENTRRERLTQLAPQLEQYGVDAQTLSSIDTSEQGWATLGQSLTAAVGQLERYADVRETDDGALVGITADGQSEVIREAPPPAWQPIPSNELPQGARYGERNSRTGETDLDWAPQGRGVGGGGAPGAYDLSRLSPQERGAVVDASAAARRANYMAQRLRRFRALNTETGTGTAYNPDHFAVLGDWRSDINRGRLEPEDRERIDEMESITEELIAYLRQPGEGTMSDADVARFRASLPSIRRGGNTNANIIDAFEQVAQNSAGYAEFIDNYVSERGTTIGAAEMWNQYLNEVPIFGENGEVNTERSSWREFFGASDGQPPQRQQQAAPDPQNMPQPGEIEDGFRFRGGDPGDPNNWEPVR
jgi:hypothetical protein